MADLDLHESAWSRAKGEVLAVYRTPYFALGVAIVELLAVPAAVLFTADADTSTATRVAVPIISGTVALVIAFLGVLVVQLGAAPYRQRDELRRGWTAEPVQTVNVDLTLRNAHRRGDELAKRLEAKKAFYSRDLVEADEWAEGVIKLMAGNAPDKATKQFIAAGRDEGGFVRRLRARVDELERIIEEKLA